MPEENKLILVSPTSLDGAPGRILTYPDGTIVVQVWNGSKWVSDKSRVVAANKAEPEKPKTPAVKQAGAKPPINS